ncbi:hypothetical protein FIV42_10420 [Persicimonas caeni]|uniref:PKD domain-containing protein n=1 Tax=Persicimonas caeni TaxID=2292766 RepID=A0A4Y6PS16_PERCE|nr:hypothetical protein [Persicimonas caeni]QDG51134.1 hypothetical protein FIV42_10420 [Persicimonas caeni]QED32355.1 hypothetical protein FRD00_10415 [Persicimonas caeni]
MKSHAFAGSIALGIALMAMTGCTSSNTDLGCVTDQECKGERICGAAGRCVYPSGGGGNNDNNTVADAGADTTSDASTPGDTGGSDERDAIALDTGGDVPTADVAQDAPATDPDAADPGDADPSDADPIDADRPDTDPTACPTAQILTRLQGQTTWQTGDVSALPLQTIEFDATASGHVTAHEWTITARPQGSTQRLLPSNTVAQPRLFLDLAGTYDIDLTVTNHDAPSACTSSASVTITATPSDDVQISLTWDTPADSDQTDNFGTDLDVHYLHPNGRWDDPPWDLFWRNPDPNWADQNLDTDDPSLDIDDTDGAGPEHVSHSNLEQLRYRVGAYYYSDNTLDQSFATVRIYLQGTLAYEDANKEMPRTGSFWDAAIIDATDPTNMQVTPVDNIYAGFPNNTP